MANSKFEYVRHFEQDDTLLRNCWLVLRIDGHNFHTFADAHKFEKPNDLRALELMNICAMEVMKNCPDIVLAYGQSDEYSFVLKRDTTFLRRRTSKLISIITSLFCSNYVFNWPTYFPSLPLLYPPSFDGRVVCYPTDENLKDYLSWRQTDCHINNLYNTCFWALVNQKKLTPKAAEAQLAGTLAEQKNELLFHEFNTNYNKLPLIYRRGSIIIWQEGPVEVRKVSPERRGGETGQIEKRKRQLAVVHDDICKDEFFQEHQIFAPSLSKTQLAKARKFASKDMPDSGDDSEATDKSPPIDQKAPVPRKNSYSFKVTAPVEDTSPPPSTVSNNSFSDGPFTPSGPIDSSAVNHYRPLDQDALDRELAADRMFLKSNSMGVPSASNRNSVSNTPQGRNFMSPLPSPRKSEYRAKSPAPMPDDEPTPTTSFMPTMGGSNMDSRSNYSMPENNFFTTSPQHIRQTPMMSSTPGGHMRRGSGSGNGPLGVGVTSYMSMDSESIVVQSSTTVHYGQSPRRSGSGGGHGVPITAGGSGMGVGGGTPMGTDAYSFMNPVEITGHLPPHGPTPSGGHNLAAAYAPMGDHQFLRGDELPLETTVNRRSKSQVGYSSPPLGSPALLISQSVGGSTRMSLPTTRSRTSLAESSDTESTSGTVSPPLSRQSTMSPEPRRSRQGSVDLPTLSTHLEHSLSAQPLGGGGGGGGGGGSGRRSRRGSFDPSDHHHLPTTEIKSPLLPTLEEGPLDIDIESKHYFKGEVDRSKAYALLNGKPLGTFLFRLCGDQKELINGKINRHLFVLTYNGRTRPINLKIWRLVGEGLTQKKENTNTLKGGSIYRSVHALVNSVIGQQARGVD